MSDFDTRPKGTVMYGAFNAFAPAERALRVLKNAGYARAALEGDAQERASGEPAVVVVDAAATGAARAAEILEEHGAQIRFASNGAVAPPAPDLAALANERPGVLQTERKPRVRKRMRPEDAWTSAPPSNVALARGNVIIVTRGIESVASDV